MSNNNIKENSSNEIKRGIDEDLCMTFPQRLMEILTKERDSNVISWLPHGKGFIIYNKKKFASDVLPRYFRQTKYTSFTRKLNRWSFCRITQRGPEYGGYYHKYFQRDEPRLCLQMCCESSARNVMALRNGLCMSSQMQHPAITAEALAARDAILRQQLSLRLEQERMKTNKLYTELMQIQQQKMTQNNTVAVSNQQQQVVQPNMAQQQTPQEKQPQLSIPTDPTTFFQQNMQYLYTNDAGNNAYSAQQQLQAPQQQGKSNIVKRATAA